MSRSRADRRSALLSGRYLGTLAAELVRAGNQNLIGDAVTGALLAEAACRAASRLVEINLQDVAGDGRRSEASRLAVRAARAREAALA